MVAVVIPTYNEAGTIEELARRIFGLKIFGMEVLVIDDSSSDGTIEKLRKLQKQFPITMVIRPKKLGLGSALTDGITLAKERGADAIVTLDGDLSHNPDCIPEMLKKISGGADLVVGSRRIKGGEIVGWGIWRTMMSRGAMEFSRRMLGISARDVTSGFRAYSRKVIDTIMLGRVSSTGYAFQEEMLYQAQKSGFRIEEIPIVFHDRKHGKSKLGVKDILEFFFTVIRLRQQKQVL
ncbi:MAG: polyprenol monophosphomannose synthase [bacterium]|nr:polyprenol monophosphomannose synthase [bacterium]